MSDDRYEIVWFRGQRFDKMTVQALLAMEKALGYELTVLQGSYNGTAVGASGGTHAGGGAVDLAPANAHQKVEIGRTIGCFAMWERPAISGLWPHHVHGILRGNHKAAGSAQRQVIQYNNRTNGLTDFAHDPFPVHPTGDYQYKVEPKIAVDASNLQIDFINALHDSAGNAPHRRVKIVQKRLNAKLPNKPLLVDGIVGAQTLNRWGAWEISCQVPAKDRNRIPDLPRLKRLLSGSIYYAVA